MDKKEEMPEKLTNCVKASVMAIFNSIFSAEPIPRGDTNGIATGDGVVGIISFVGDVTWLLMLVLPKTSAQAIAFKFTNFEVAYDSPDMGDVVGELSNVLAGDIVARLSAEGIKVAMSLPTIMRGHDVEPLLPRGLPSLKMHYTIPDGGDVFLKLAGTKPGQTVGRRPGT
jgi:CheY-specific phosphatase CheX